MKILVVENNPIDLKLARLVLTHAGHDVAGAESVQLALDAIRKEKPMLVLLDLDLPGTEGLELARALKANADTRDIHITALTAYPQVFGKDKAIAAGCDGYLVKPMDTRTLSEELTDSVESPPHSG